MSQQGVLCLFWIFYGLMLSLAQGLRLTDPSCFELDEVIDYKRWYVCSCMSTHTAIKAELFPCFSCFFSSSEHRISDHVCVWVNQGKLKTAFEKFLFAKANFSYWLAAYLRLSVPMWAIYKTVNKLIWAVHRCVFLNVEEWCKSFYISCVYDGVKEKQVELNITGLIDSFFIIKDD